VTVRLAPAISIVTCSIRLTHDSPTRRVSSSSYGAAADDDAAASSRTRDFSESIWHSRLVAETRLSQALRSVSIQLLRVP